MLNWTIETKRGCFQGNDLGEVIYSAIEFYGMNNKDVEEITDIFACDDGEILQQCCESEISKIQNQIEQQVRNWKKGKSSEGGREIESDYYLNLI